MRNKVCEQAETSWHGRRTSRQEGERRICSFHCFPIQHNILVSVIASTWRHTSLVRGVWRHVNVMWRHARSTGIDTLVLHQTVRTLKAISFLVFWTMGQLVGPCGTDTCDCTSIVYSRDVVDVYLRIEDYWYYSSFVFDCL